MLNFCRFNIIVAHFNFDTHKDSNGMDVAFNAPAIEDSTDQEGSQQKTCGAEFEMFATKRTILIPKRHLALTNDGS